MPQEAREGCAASRGHPGNRWPPGGIKHGSSATEPGLPPKSSYPTWLVLMLANSLGGVSGAAPWERGHGWTGAVASGPYPTAHILSRRWGLQCLWGPVALCGLGGQGWEEEAGRGDDGLRQSPAPPSLLTLPTPHPPASSDASIALSQKQPGWGGSEPRRSARQAAGLGALLLHTPPPDPSAWPMP